MADWRYPEMCLWLLGKHPLLRHAWLAKSFNKKRLKNFVRKTLTKKLLTKSPFTGRGFLKETCNTTSTSGFGVLAVLKLSVDRFKT
ncbi:hypothetical protein LOS15_12365 [Halomonas sp. 7T]|uniref:hypothetical protein n=1 Tax=Halomonas sp. 7T TaxID=2893469 RepID=UPI0021DB432C|nr:hypothetical protein [Halomonas sp. 7T]UXZ53608.1 hypothetical protein LOS15_12365 [Halomonas sp. 7T]